MTNPASGGFQFTPATGLNDTATYPSTPISEAAARQQFMDIYWQLMNEMNLPTLSAAAYALYNKIINGNFDVWQRGTSFTNPINNQYTLDRWITMLGGTATLPTVTHSQQSLVPGDIFGSNNFYRISPNGAGSGYLADVFYFIAQMVENGTKKLCGSGKKVTISFYARSSIAGKRLGISCRQNYGSGGSPSSVEELIGTVITLTSTWTKYTCTFTTFSLVGKTFGTNNDDYLRFSFWPVWGANYNAYFNTGAAETFIGAGNIDIAQVQVNAGDQALPFQPRSYVQEEEDTKRYCINFQDDTNAAETIGIGYAISTTVAYIHVDLGKTMRIVPTLVATAADWQLSDGVNAASVLTAISLLAGQNNNKIVTLQCTVASGLTQYRPYRLLATAVSKKMIFDSEL